MLVTAEPTRRRVLCGLAVALLAPGAVAAACSSDGDDPTVDTGAPPAPSPTSKAPGEPDGAIVKVSEVPVGGGVIVLIDGNQVLLVQPKAGTLEAFDPVCPHQGFTVNVPKGGVIVCPGHGSRFDAATGARKSGPAPHGLTKIPVKVTGGYVVST
jgi:cytochrome b6-f complex iron-sulfur subunit